MTKIRAIFLGVGVMLLGLVVLYACGGDNPTATPIPATATATSVPATNTPVPPPATDTPLAAAGETATTGTGGTSGGGSTTNPADAALIQQAITNSESLKSYHFLMNASGDVFTQTIKVEGDYQAPDRSLMTVTTGGTSVQQLVVGSDVYTKDASGNWVLRPTPTPSTDLTSQMFDANSLVTSANPLNGLRSFVESASDYKDAGTDTINGVQVRHFTFDIDTAKLLGSSADQIKQQMGGNLPSLGTGELWIDPATKQVVKYKMSIDFGFLMQMLTQAFSAIGGTPTPGGATATPFPAMKINVDVTVSKHNDPSISVPTPPASAGGSGSEAATPTP